MSWIREQVPKEELRCKGVVCSHIQSQTLAGSAGGYLENNANCFTFQKPCWRIHIKASDYVLFLFILLLRSADQLPGCPLASAA